LATELRRLELHPGGEHGTRQRDRDGRAWTEVPRAADDLARLALPHVDPAELQAIGVRMLPGFEHAPDAEVAKVSVDLRDATALDPLDLGGGDAEPLGKFRERHVDRDVVAQPADGDPQNCLSTRRSGDQSGRISSMPYRSCAERSRPQPNAKPLHSSGSGPTFSHTPGPTMPAPPSARQPPNLH